MPPFIYLNGYPGVGKQTIAKELAKLIPKSRIVNNHLLIDPVAAIFERTAEEYQSLRKVLRQEVLKSLATAESAKNVTWIFTDQQSSSQIGSAAAKDYQDAAIQAGCPFVSIILQCSLDENLKRAVGEGRGESNTKLRDPDILRSIREREDIIHFGDECELELDITHLSPCDAAARILEHIGSRGILVVPASLVKRFSDISGFKHIFIEDLFTGPSGITVSVLCWVTSGIRRHGGILFFSASDSTGAIQVVAESSRVDSWSELKRLKPESSIIVTGSLTQSRGSFEIAALHVKIISKATRTIHPDIRKADPTILDARNTDQLLSYRHLYLRHPTIVALNVYRSRLFSAIHHWFRVHRFVDFSAPLITPSILYEPNSAIHISNLKVKKPLYLSQCAGFYLEAAAHAHERVYNLGPSFRNESRTNRHLMEYWHIKAELCSGTMDDIIDLVEIFIRDINEATAGDTQQLTAKLGTRRPEIEIPFQRITYGNAVSLLQSKGHEVVFGKNISKAAEDLLTSHFGGPIWLTHKPRELEPFPYCLCPDDNNLTMTADLISSDGFGEICGVAEKSFTRHELETRLSEKGKMGKQDVYGWVLESRDFGMVPHTAFGMGFERFVRWLCRVPHVKDVVPFPRIFGRDPTP